MGAFAEIPIAVIGMACRLPGAANLDEFWRLLVEGRSAIVDVPPSRIDRHLYYDAQPSEPFKTYNVRGGLVDYAPFDATRCPTPERIMPQCEIGHLTICQVAADACRHANLNPFDLPLRNVGVYIGHNIGGPVGGRLIYRTNVANTARHLLNVPAFREIAGDHPEQLVDKLVERIRGDLPKRNPSGTPECATRLASMIISEALGLTGPSMILDAACSSALQGLAMASRRLQLGRIDMAIVGGASFYHVDGQMIFSRAQSASRRGVSSPFDMRADGLIPSEGYVAVVVKTLERAIADGDPVQCVVRGIGVASDGRGKSLWAPRKEGQILAMRRAYQNDADIARLQFVEAHATSTRVGDVTELGAIADALTSAGVTNGSVAIGAVKANLGHTLEPAGLVGLVKTTLAMQHRTIPKQIHFEQPNSGIDWNNAPFHVPVENAPWPVPADGGPRRAAVNSFGIGGLNVHVALDEYVAQQGKRATRPVANSNHDGSPRHEPIAIVGAGCVLPGARSFAALNELIASGHDARFEAPADRWQSHAAYDVEAQQLLKRSTLRGGFVTDYQFDWRRHKLPPIQVAKMDPLQLMVLDATDAALTDSGFDRATCDKQRVGVVVGTVFGGDFSEQLQMGFRLPDFCESLAAMLRDRGVAESQVEAISAAYVAEFLKNVTALLDETGSFTSSTLASRLTKTFDFMGGAVTIDAGNASSTAAIAAAIDMLHDGTCDMVICAAGSRAMGLSTYEFMASSGQLANDANKNRGSDDDGRPCKYLPGEGSGVVVLKRLSDARRDGSRIRAVIRDVGASFSSDATAAIGQATERAKPSSVGSPLLKSRSLRDQIGYTHGVSGMASLFASMFALDESKDSSPNAIAHVNDLDSYGAAYHLVLSQPAAELEPQRPIDEPAVEPTVAPPAPADPIPTWRVVRLEANSLNDLRAEVLKSVENVESLWDHESSFGSKAYRLATIADGPATLLKKLQVAAEALATGKRQLLTRHDIFIGQPTVEAKVALVFSGQGSQYPGMMQAVVEQVPGVAGAMQDIDRVLARHGLPDFATMAWTEPEGLGIDVQRTQVAILCADMLAFRAIESLDVRPDFMAGHSFGEFAALAAADAWDFESALRGTLARCHAIESCQHVQGAMLSVAASTEDVDRLCRLASEPVYAANLNSPDQTVVAGTNGAIERFETFARSEKVACRRLAVPRPFHSPLMADVRVPLAEGLSAIAMTSPRVRVLSTVTVDLVASGDVMRANLLDQLTSPVRYFETIANLVDRGVRIFIEVGPQRVLTGLNERILAASDVVAVSVDDKARPGASRLLAIAACLEVNRLPAGRVEPANAPVVDSTAYRTGRERGRTYTSAVRGIARSYADACGMNGDASTIIASDDALLSADEVKTLRRIADETGVSLAMLRHLRATQPMSPTTDTPESSMEGWTLPCELPNLPTLSAELISIVNSPEVASRASADDVDTSLASRQFLSEICFDECYARMQSVNGGPPFETAGQVCERFELRLLQTRVTPIDEAWRTLSGLALIVGRNPVAVALRHELERLGIKAIVVPLSDEDDVTLAAVDTIWKSYQPRHLFFVTAHDPDATTNFDHDHWAQRRQLGVMLPYLVCQRWFSHLVDNNLVQGSSVIAATAMGGDFGLSRLENVESGALAGLVKGLVVEHGYTSQWKFRAKVVDTSPHESPHAIAASLVHELRCYYHDPEVGYRDGNRYAHLVVREPHAKVEQRRPTRGRPWLITGGARGITAAIALELGKRFGVKLYLLGTTARNADAATPHDLTAEQRKQLRAEVIRTAIAERQVPALAWERVEKSIEIEKTLRAMEAAGVEFEYHVCDVSDAQAMADLLANIRQAHGPLEGVIHGAGIEKATRFTKKNAATVDRTVAAKVDGAALLMRLTQDDALSYFIGFGSISGRWGAIGQTDYAMASDMLAKLIVWYRQQKPGCFATCIHWQPWADIGMAARDETRGADVLQKLELLPVAEGIEHFFRELTGGCSRPEVVITDWNYYKGFYPDLSAEIAEQLRAFDATVRKPTPAQTHVSPQVAQRQVMRVVPSTASAPPRPFAFAGPALVLGDGADAEALVVHLNASGVRVVPLPILDSIDETLERLQSVFSEQALPHLFAMTSREPLAASIDDDLSAWDARRKRGVLLPFAVCQKWVALVSEAGLLNCASLVAATSLGGDFGFESHVQSPEGGALSGLLKGLYMELVQPGNSKLHLRVIDAPSDEPSDSLARSIVAELAYDDADIEIAYRDAQRHVVRLMTQPIEPSPISEITRGGTWVITGGARGIAAAVAKELGRRYGLKLHLLGTRPTPPEGGKLIKLSEAELADLKRSLVRKAMGERQPAGKYWDEVRRDLEIERNLQEFATAGISATYHQCDVCDTDALETTLQQIRSIDGPIQGVVHSAGIHGSPTSIEDTTLEMTDALLAVKVDAAYNLMRLTRDDPMRYFVSFGSLSGRFGSMKASAYALVSDYLCKLVGWYRRRRPDCHAVGFHWHPWGEVGMMTRPVSQHTITVFKMQLMSPAEGVQHLIDELRAGTPESEVLVTDFQFVDAFSSRSVMLGGESPAAAAKTPSLPLIDGKISHESDLAVVATRLDPVNDVFLCEHWLRQKPTLPLVVALELFAEASRLIANEASLTAFRDVEISDAVRFFSDETIEVRTSVESSPSGVRAKVTSDLRNRRGQLLKKDREHFSASIELGDLKAIEASPPAEPREWFDVTYPDSDAPMYHGLSLRQLKRVAVGEGCALGEIIIADGEPLNGTRIGNWIVPSATLDACLYACGVYVWATMNGAFAVPQSVAELRFATSPRAGETTRVHVVPVESDERLAAFDFTLFGEDDRVILAARRYRCHVLNDPTSQHSANVNSIDIQTTTNS